MTREQAIEIIKKEYACVDAECDIERSCSKCELMMPSKEPILEAYKMAIQALSQEPQCTEQPCLGTLCRYYKEPCRVKNELNAELNELKPCTDAVSRDAILEGLKGCICEEWIKTLFATMVKQLPPVTQKSGKWITDARTYYEELNKRGLGVDEYTPYFTDDIACSECLAKYNMYDNETQFFKHCPNCGCRMVEPQEVRKNKG